MSELIVDGKAKSANLAPFSPARFQARLLTHSASASRRFLTTTRPGCAGLQGEGDEGAPCRGRCDWGAVVMRCYEEDPACCRRRRGVARAVGAGESACRPRMPTL